MRVRKLEGGRLEITRNGGKSLSVGVIRVRGGGQKAQPLSGIATELRGCLEAGGGRCRNMAGMRKMAGNRYLWDF